MSSPDTNEAKFMVNIFDSNGDRVTTDLAPGDYNLVLEVKNILAAVGDNATHLILLLNLRIDRGEFQHISKTTLISGEENSLELPFSIDKWMDHIRAVAFIYAGNESRQTRMLATTEMERKVTSQFKSSKDTQ